MCSEEFHNNFSLNYEREPDGRFCNNGYLEDAICVECTKKLVHRCNDEEHEVKVSETFPAAVCRNCIKSKCKHVFCDKCFTAKLQSCGNSPKSPRKMRKVAKYTIDN